VSVVSDVRQIDITLELLLPDPSPFEAEMAFAMLKSITWPSNDKLLAELIQARFERGKKKSQPLF
jgi:hypothetical protein